MTLQFLELFDPLTDGFDRVLQRLSPGLDFYDFLFQILNSVDLIGLEEVHRLAECFGVSHAAYV